jgi:hypothetical protein
MVLRGRTLGLRPLPPSRQRKFLQPQFVPPKPVVSRASDAELGALIHTVDNRRCPVCDSGGPMGIFALGVRWPCGHTRSLPAAPTGSNGKKRTS